MTLRNNHGREIMQYAFKDGLPVEFEIIDLTNLYQSHRQGLVNPHRTAFYHIILFNEGASIHFVDFKEIKVKPGSLIFLNKDVVQQFSDSESSGVAILFTEKFFVRSQEDIRFLKSTVLFNDLFEVAHIDTETISSPILSLINSLTRETGLAFDPFQSDILYNFLHNLLLFSEREYRQRGFREIKKSRALDITLEFKDHVEKMFRTDRHVNHFALKMNITEKRLNKATSAVLGKTPKQVIDDRVLLESKRLLAYSSDSIKEVGYELGFEEPTNFIKYFRKHTRYTPAEFRAQSRVQ
jgi:AraC family transcriptional activator of pobA